MAKLHKNSDLSTTNYITNFRLAITKHHLENNNRINKFKGKSTKTIMNTIIQFV